MRTAEVWLVLGLSGCGISEEKFEARYQEAYCEALDDCGSPRACEDTEGSTTVDYSLAGCVFDPAKAKDCLDATWSCDLSQEPVAPASCASVYDCSGAS